MRFRLYDIDVIINRTLAYGSLTAALVAVYFGGTVVMQRLSVVLTGEKSTLAVVASTLLIAALFSPLRRRIQSLVDRRFYRSKYDVRKTLEAFNSRLREETDIDALSSDVVGVARKTVQPAHVYLWLRPDAEPEASSAAFTQPGQNRWEAFAAPSYVPFVPPASNRSFSVAMSARPTSVSANRKKPPTSASTPVVTRTKVPRCI